MSDRAFILIGAAMLMAYSLIRQRQRMPVELVKSLERFGRWGSTIAREVLKKSDEKISSALVTAGTAAVVGTITTATGLVVAREFAPALFSGVAADSVPVEVEALPAPAGEAPPSLAPADTVRIGHAVVSMRPLPMPTAPRLPSYYPRVPEVVVQRISPQTSPASDPVSFTTGAASGLWPNQPPTWTDVIHDDDMSTLSPFETGGVESGNPPQWMIGSWLFSDWGFAAGNTHGSCRGTGHVANFVRDSAQAFVTAGALDVWVHEHCYYATTGGGGGDSSERLDLADGNGPAATSSASRVYIGFRIAHTDTDWPTAGSLQYQFNFTSTKVLYIVTTNNTNGRIFEVVQQTTGITPMPAHPTIQPSCTVLYGTDWNDSFPGDTTNWSGGPCWRLGDIDFNFGTFDLVEICLDNATGTAAWYFNGIRAVHRTGYTVGSFGDVTAIRFSGTWGGGGDKTQDDSRYVDHVYVTTGSSGTCVT